MQIRFNPSVPTLKISSLNSRVRMVNLDIKNFDATYTIRILMSKILMLHKIDQDWNIDVEFFVASKNNQILIDVK
jgi:hypothetical protein